MVAGTRAGGSRSCAAASFSFISYKFFKAAIEVDVPNNEDP